jgi:RNA polymerase sigma factor for flagellar operon FliA
LTGRDVNAVYESPTQTLTPERERALWSALREHGDESAREALLAHHMPYARVIAGKLYAGRTHDDIEFDDYLQYASIGLLEALDRYEPDRGAQFRTYASTRMMGAVLDGLERLSERQQQIALRQRLRAREARAASLAEDVGSARDAVLLQQMASIGIGLALGVLLDGMGMIESETPAAAPSPYEGVALRQMQRRVRDLIKDLPDAERRIIRHHYLQGLPFDEIAEQMSLSKGRISQLHKRAIERLRAALKETNEVDATW